MKKILSIALVLAMCLAIFAGCENVGNEPTGDSPLAAAAEYLFTMYKPASKDEPTKQTTDTDITAIVTIDGVTYNVEWSVKITSGPADGVKISASDTANFVKLDIMDQPEEELYYTLTATIKDEAGNQETVSFNYFTPAVKKVDVSASDKVVIYNPGDGKYMTDTEYLYTSSSSGNQKYELELTEDKSEAVALTVQENDDGTISFVTDDGRYLFCDANNVQFVTEQDDNTKFVLEAAEGGSYIKCAVANYSGKPQYLELYSGYMTCYGMTTDATKLGLYIFELQAVEGVSQSAILDAAYSLGTDEALDGTYTLTGEITKINTAWDEGYQNITVTIVCDGDTERPVQCFRLKGEGAKDLAVGDKITVTGTIKNYSGTVEFDAGCNLDKVVKAEGGENPGGDDPAVPTVSILPEFTSPIADGNKVVIVATDYSKAFSTLPVSEGSYYQKGVDVTVADGTVTGYAETEVWTVIVNDDGTYSFSYNDQKIGMQDSYSSMGLGHVNDKWELIALDNGSYLLKNVVRGNYMQWASSYGNFSTYGSDAPEADGQFYLSLYVVE